MRRATRRCAAGRHDHPVAPPKAGSDPVSAVVAYSTQRGDGSYVRRAEAGLIRDVARTEEAGLAVAEASVTLRVPGVRVPGGGRTWDYRASEAVAVLEALERYGGSNPTGKRTVVRAAMADLEEPALDPRR